jgi:hypothetical protein
MTGLMDHPTFVRNLALVGHLHHGKTLLMDLLVQLTHKKDWNPEKEYRYTDTRKDEQVWDLLWSSQLIYMHVQIAVVHAVVDPCVRFAHMRCTVTCMDLFVPSGTWD